MQLTYLLMKISYNYCELKKNEVGLPFLFAAEISDYLQKIINSIFNAYHGLERACDAIPHINTPVCIYCMFSMNYQHKFNHCQGKKAT